MPSVFAQLEFEYPGRLFWLAVLPLLLYFSLRSQSAIAKWRRITSMFCRMALVSLLVVAFSGLVDRRQSDRQFVVFVNDSSHSIGVSRDQAEKFITESLVGRGDHRVAFLNFADAPTPLSDDPDFKFQPGFGSAPSAAVRYATASIPDDHVPKIVLLTDGIETHGDLLRVVVDSDVPVSVVPLAAFPSGEICLRELFVPLSAPPNSEVIIEAVIDSNRVETCYVEAVLDGNTVSRHRVALEVGENRVRIPTPFGDADVAAYQVRVSAANDTIESNNMRRAAILAGPRTRVLLAGEESVTGGLRKTLSNQGFAVTAMEPSSLPEDPDAFAAYDVVVLSDVQTAELPQSQTRAIERYVHDLGGGLIAVGSEDTFGDLAFRGSDLERLLPVKSADQVETRKSVLALTLVIDRSSSMINQGEDRISLAKEAAKLAVKTLGPHDKIGIIAFSNEPVWITEMSTCDDKPALIEQIDTLTADGQTQMYPAVERAYFALQQTDADRRHMIVLTDGVPLPGDYDRIARQMAESGITLTTVTMGSGAEQAVMRDMADIAKGKFRPCPDSSQLPSIIETETHEISSDDGPTAFQAFTLRKLPGLEVSSAPPLLGYAPTSPKSDAELLLIAAGGDPLLCWWRYGRGVSVAFTTNISGSWGERWRQWPGHGAFWQRLIQHSKRERPADLVDVLVSRNGYTGSITVDAIDPAGNFLDQASVEIQIVRPDETQQSLPALQVAPGRYQVNFPMTQTGLYRADVTVDMENAPLHQKHTFFVDYEDELRLHSTNEQRLRLVAATTGGVYQPQPANVFQPDGRYVEIVESFWRLLVAISLGLFLVDIVVRRLR